MSAIIWKYVHPSPTVSLSPECFHSRTCLYLRVWRWGSGIFLVSPLLLSDHTVSYSPQSFCFIEEHDVQLHISLLLLTAVICHLLGVPSSLKLEGGGTGSWSFFLPSGFRGLVDDVTHTLTWTAPSSTYFHSCTSKTHCHTPWTLSLPNAALILKLIIPNSHYLIITFIFPACLQNNLHLYNTQSIKEQRMCASYRLGHSQKEDVGMNRTCLSWEENPEMSLCQDPFPHPSAQPPSLIILAFLWSLWSFRDWPQGRGDWQSTSVFLLPPP